MEALNPIIVFFAGGALKEFRICHVIRNFSFPNGRIIGLGIEAYGSVFSVRLETIMEKMSEGFRFYVDKDGYKAYIEVAIHPVTVRKYVRTIADNTTLDNLESLPQIVPGYGCRWQNPAEETYLPSGASTGWLTRRKNTTFPSALDTHGTAPNCESGMAVGFYNYYDGDYLIGSISGNTLYRGYVWIDGLENLDDRPVTKAVIKLKLLNTVNWCGSNASNIGSALSSVWRLDGPWVSFVAPWEMPAVCIVSSISKDTGNAVYDEAAGEISIDVTATVESWRKKEHQNFGLMFVGPNEAKQVNNDAYYSCYDVISVRVEQEIDFPWDNA